VEQHRVLRLGLAACWEALGEAYGAQYGATVVAHFLPKVRKGGGQGEGRSARRLRDENWGGLSARVEGCHPVWPWDINYSVVLH
jgi:hypothetical protein